MAQQNSTFNDSTELTKWTKWFLCLQAGIAIIALISGVLEYNLLNDFNDGVYASEIEAVTAGEASDRRQKIVGIAQIIILVVSNILFLMWTYRANFNARQLGASGMRFTPGWSIGWYFIPIANVFKPYQAMKEIWMVSMEPQDWENQLVPSLLEGWWFFLIVSNVLGRISFRMAQKADQIDELISANIVTMLSDATQVPASLIALAIVMKVYEMQMSHHKPHV